MKFLEIDGRQRTGSRAHRPHLLEVLHGLPWGARELPVTVQMQESPDTKSDLGQLSLLAWLVYWQDCARYKTSTIEMMPTLFCPLRSASGAAWALAWYLGGDVRKPLWNHRAVRRDKIIQPVPDFLRSDAACS